MTRFRMLALAVVSACTLAGCATTSSPGPAISPAEQCEAVQAALDTAVIASIYVEVEEEGSRIALEAAIAAAQSAADDFCAASARGESPEAQAALLRAYRAGLAEFSRQARAARAASDQARGGQ